MCNAVLWASDFINRNDRNNRNKYCHLLPMWANKPLEFKITSLYRELRKKGKAFWKWGVPNQGLGRDHLIFFQLSGAPLYTALTGAMEFQPISTDKLFCDSDFGKWKSGSGNLGDWSKLNTVHDFNGWCVVRVIF